MPKGLVGGALGAVGAASLVPVARNLAIRWLPPPHLPGAELAAGDSKAATLVEVAVFLTALPLAAYFFGKLLPLALERRFPRGRLSFEWIPLGFSLWLPFWRRGIPPQVAILSSCLLSILIALFIAAFRRLPRVRRYFVQSNRSFLFHLALAGAAWDLARRSDPSLDLVFLRDPLIEIIASGLALLIVLLVIVDRLGSLRGLSSRLRRVAAFAPLSLSFSALAIVFWRSAVVLLVAALLTFAAAFITKTPPLVRHGFRLAVLFFVFFSGLTIYYQPFAAINLYEDGHRLTYAQAYIHGARPYVDTYPIHGWGYDGGGDALAFRVAGSTLAAFRIRQALMTALALVCVALACLAAFESVIWSAVAFTATLSFCPFVSERHLLVFGSLALLAAGARSGRRMLFILAGVVTAWEVFFSLDFGVILLLGGLVGVVLRPLLESGYRRIPEGFSQAALFVLGAIGGAIPFLLMLVQKDALGAFVRTSFREIPLIASDTWGLPAGSLSQALKQSATVGDSLRILSGEVFPSFFTLAIFVLAGSAYLFRAVKRRFTRADGLSWLFFTVGCVALRGVLGRSDSGHLALYGLFAAVPATWLLERGLFSATWRPAPFLALFLFLLIRLHPVGAIDTELRTVSGAARARAELASRAMPERLGGRAGLPRDQAMQILALKAYLDDHISPQATFFDFAAQPGLYFLTGRVMPIRFLAPPFYETPAAQAEVIEALERLRPPVAILAGSAWTDAFDRVTNRERAPQVAEYLDSHYARSDRVHGWTVAFRR